jgi:hypothetical protein
MRVTFITFLLFCCYLLEQNAGGLNADDDFPGADASLPNIIGPSITTATWSAIQTLPFGLNFNGAPVTQYKVSSTGVVICH